jgi:hypothetical protein
MTPQDDIDGMPRRFGRTGWQDPDAAKGLPVQPRFPASHHFHRRRRPPLAEREIASLAERGLRDLERQLLPAGNPGDPRWIA